MKSILCYGDSNTWGAIPKRQEVEDTRRYSAAERWPGVLRDRLGAGFVVAEEGLNGRTTALDDPYEGAHKNGLFYLLPCLETHQPIDLVVVMLGTNDLKHRFGLSAYDIACGAAALLDLILSRPCGRQAEPPRALLICPAPLARLDRLADMFANAGPKSQDLQTHYREAAERRGVFFLNAGDHIHSSDIDGIHLDADQHVLLGEAVAVKIKEIFAGD